MNQLDARIPLHLRVVSIVLLVWSVFGALDFGFLVTRAGFYTARFGKEQLAFLDGYPAWLIGVWAVAVATGLAAGVTLVLRRRAAIALLAASAIAAGGVAGRNVAVGEGGFDPGVLGFFAALLALLIYLLRMQNSGHLR